MFYNINMLIAIMIISLRRLVDVIYLKFGY